MLKKCKEKIKKAKTNNLIKKKRKSGAPKISATCYKIGHTKLGTDLKTYIVVKSGKSRRWSKK